MIGNASSSFSDLMIIGECIESGLKRGRIQGSLSSKTSESESIRNSQKEEEDEIKAIWEITKLRKFHIQCLTIWTCAYQLFRVKNLLGLYIRCHSPHMFNILLQIEVPLSINNRLCSSRHTDGNMFHNNEANTLKGKRVSLILFQNHTITYFHIWLTMD